MAGGDRFRGDSGNDGGTNGGGDGSPGGSGQDSGENGPSTAEKAVMAISATFTVLLLAFVIWQALATPVGVPPQAAVVGTQPMPDGGVEVAVRLTNPGDGGLRTVTVEVACTGPPREIQFQHVPADDYQEGYVACPPGMTEPNASVSWWIEA